MLDQKIRQIIKTSGPMPLSDYMAMCLYDPHHGYYTTREPFGGGGDFTTAPEVSQMFGEIIGAWLIHTWRIIGRPDPFTLAEIGPGRGTLMGDILRTAGLDPGFLSAADIHLIETSPRLRDMQRKTLDRFAATINWHNTLAGLPEGPVLLVANELFDAIPIRQLQRTSDDWCERMIGIGVDGGLCFTAGPASPDPAPLPSNAVDQPIGTVWEYAPARDALADEIGTRISKFGGAALIFDYGHAAFGFGETLQAVRRHQYASVFSNQGECDLTSHVDFSALTVAATSSGAVALPLMTQGEFLLSLGLLERAGSLGSGKDVPAQLAIEQSARRLAGTDAAQMGELFKVLCITDKPRALPPFEEL